MPTPPSAPAQHAAVILLDMNGTFMFGHDRFDARQDFHGCYRRLGGSRLGAPELHAAIRRCLAAFQLDYEDPTRWGDFPSLATHIRDHAQVPRSEHALLEQVITAHELGQVPPACVKALQALSNRYRLAVVSNIWCDARHARRRLREAGVHDLFATCVFSSDLGAVKPTDTPFLAACRALGGSPDQVLMVGDDWRRDILPARRLGLRTCWISQTHAPEGSGDVAPDLPALTRRLLLGS